LIKGLYKAGSLESLESAVLLDGAESAGRDREDDRLLELRHVDALFLQVRIPADVAARVELSGTGAVRVASTDD